MASLYRPLDKEKREIRLLKLLPSDGPDEPPRCQLISRFLEEAGDYEALSYVWGDSDLTEGVDVDGHKRPVTRNLHIALQQLRWEKEPRILWVDALCINQDDLTERSHQVSFMKNIYHHCKRDIAWLGPTANSPKEDNREEDSVRTSFDLIEKIHARRARMLQNDRSKIRSEVIRLIDRDDVHTLQSTFAEFPLWRRIWVVQELICAPRVTLMYGRQSLEWQVLSDILDDWPHGDAFHTSSSHGTTTPMTDKALSHVARLEQQRRITRDTTSGHTSTLLDVLARFKGLLARDPRDHIYGLLGLVNENHTIRVDYSKTPEQVFTGVAEFIINSHGNLDIICQNPWKTDDLEQEPSWVPSINSETHVKKDDDRLMGLLFAQRSIFAAGRPRTEVPAVIVSDKLLRVKGTVIGTVGTILQEDYPMIRTRLRSYEPRQHAPRDWMKLYFNGTLLEEGGTLYHNNESRLRAYWRTLIMDCKGYPIQRLAAYDIESTGKACEEHLGESNNTEEKQSPWCSRGTSVMWGRNYRRWTFSVSENGLFLMLKGGARQGDVIAVLDGGKVPMLLREASGLEGDEKIYTVIDSVYVHGYMDGEAVLQIEQGKLEENHFYLG